MFQLTSVPVLSHAVVIFLSSIVSTPNGEFLDSVTIASSWSDVSGSQRQLDPLIRRVIT
jgi:hypothetical protein